MGKVLLTFITIPFLVMTAPAKSQPAAPECDFSSYKPLFMSHALPNAVVNIRQLEWLRGCARAGDARR
jgi:hypothetical protein